MTDYPCAGGCGARLLRQAARCDDCWQDGCRTERENIVRAEGIAEGRRQALDEAIAALRAERDHWHQVATCDPPGPTLRERALARVDGLTSGIERIEALKEKESEP